MRIKTTVAIAGLAALAIGGTTATAGNGDKVTGGGQVLFSTDDVKRSTIAFTAQGTATDAKGQVQFIDRSLGAGKNQTRYHGVVNCVEVSGNFAVVSGYPKGDPEGPEFLLRVVDNGQGQDPNDMIEFDEETTDNTCGGESDDDNELTVALAKGNVKVRDGNPNNGTTNDEDTEPGTSATAAGLLGLF